jgi:hypothetical protein
MLLLPPVADILPVATAMRDGVWLTWAWNDGSHGWASLAGSAAVIAQTSGCLDRRFNIKPVPVAPLAPYPKVPGVIS